jgi:RHH-type proline utilization regulon transcriptional repressor/proline dehydrogenase/delta 1-pyrroline-5-carboxylate dehydrogenase
MLKGAMAELSIGNPDRLAIDIGPVITEEARGIITRHIDKMRTAGHSVQQLQLSDMCRQGTFVAPTLIEINALKDLDREVFGPVLHVLRFDRGNLDQLIADINATGYGLTFGVHTRIDETIAYVTDRISAGNIYVNRNIVGAVVGVQPFGGHSLSGTGPKAGGPLYLRRLLAAAPKLDGALVKGKRPALAEAWIGWLDQQGKSDIAARCRHYLAATPYEAMMELPGPVGERNLYGLTARGKVLCSAESETGLLLQIGAALATGNQAVVVDSAEAQAILAKLTPDLRRAILVERDVATAPADVALFEGDSDALHVAAQILARRDGAIIPIYGIDRVSLAAGTEDYALEWLMSEHAVSTNTAAAGGNASLMAIG